MKDTIGNPPFDIYGMLDTGSDLLWTQCEPCQGCYKQMNPKFNPKKKKSSIPKGPQHIVTFLVLHKNVKQLGLAYAHLITLALTIMPMEVLH